MKTSFATLVLVSYATLIAALEARSVAGDRASALCANLDGVLDLGEKRLPAGVEASDLRLCSGHPNGLNINFDPAQGASLAPWQAVGGPKAVDTNVVARSEDANGIFARACYTAAPYGCSGGYCWKQCGDTKKGEWCWTAGE